MVVLRRGCREGAQRETANRHKERGNQAFRSGRHDEAVRCYSRAIEALPTEPTFYSNRAAALLKLMRFAEAKADCDRALELGKDFNVKTLLRWVTVRCWGCRLSLQRVWGAQR